MALSIPIVSTFDGGGISKAINEFKNLETNGQKAQFAIKKAAVPAAAALAGVTAALGDAVAAAIADAAAQDALAQQIKRTTGATDAQIAGVEDWITVQGRLLGVADDDLRPALEKLTRATGNIKDAQGLASQAMDIAAAKHIDLGTAVNAVEKAYGGNLTALKKLAPELGPMIKGGADLDTVMQALSKTFGGAASEAANTTAGKFARMKLALDETKESIGASLMPVVEAILPILQKFSDWAQKNPEVFTIIGVAIGGIAIAILAINTAMALNPIGLIVIGIGLLITAVGIAYKKFETFRTIVDDVFGAIKWWISNVTLPIFNGLLSAAVAVFNGIAAVWNNTVGKLHFTIPSWVPLLGGKEFAMPKIGGSGGGGGGGGSAADFRAFEEAQKVVSSVPATVGTTTTISAAPTAVKNTEPPMTPYKSEGVTAGGLITGGLPDITINAGMISSPASLGQDIIDAILAAQRNSGVVFQPATGL